MAQTAPSYSAESYTNLPEDAQSPPYQQVSRRSTSSISGLSKPIVVPQSTNVFMIKTFSPFARSYAPVLATLPNPISENEFLQFIDGLNNAFLSAPIFQAMHIAGGGLLGSQILPAQAVGGVFQLVSVAGSAGVSILRVRSYMKKMDAQLWAPRGLSCKLLTTKKMMAAIGFQDADGKGKLNLPSLNNLSDIGAGTVGDVQQGMGPDGEIQIGPEDPRVRRLRALEAYVAPLSFEVPDEQLTGYKKWANAPIRWVNKRGSKKVDKVRAKSLKKREEKAPEVEAETAKSQHEIAELEHRISMLRQPGASEADPEKSEELHRLEEAQRNLIEQRDHAIADIYEKGDKKLLKLYKKEEKIANRILWVVISRADGTSGDDLVQVGTNDE
ncbi:hypothetical protein PVAG01_02288 [Phlyctema vagabunda]|uniref:Uncharacterized protein n=1 Tax=Phlyctema vagabunda TaxID=108571 RepID=A0ABR4PQT1_9HELO